MKSLTALVLALTLSVAAHAAPSQQSFAELLKLTATQAKLDALARNIDRQLKDAFYLELVNHATSPAIEYTVSFRKKVQENFRNEITVEYLAGAYVQGNDAGWTQEEVDALLALAEKPAGRTALAKLVGTGRSIELLAGNRIATFRQQPAQSLPRAMKEVLEINAKALAAEKAQAAVTTLPDGKAVATLPPPAESPKSK